jgi:hypothetical protein
MARARVWLQLQDGRSVSRQLPGLLVKDELEDLVSAEVGHEHEAIAPINDNRVRVSCSWDDL